jgi:uncharacterized protein
MARLDLDHNQAQFQIRSFKPGAIRVNNQTFAHSIILTPDQLILDWGPQTITELTSESLQPIIAFKPDVLLLGTGSALVLVPAHIYGELINHGIGVEIMNTGAACRTFNALSAENRHVAAALIIK